MIDFDMFMIVGASALMVIIWVGFVLWGVKTKQFEDMERLRTKPLEEDE